MSQKLLADLHIHTIASGHAYSTFKEVAEEAQKKELKLIAVTDHGPAMPGGASLYHFWNLKALPDRYCDVRILKGAEANIVDLDGNIDIVGEVVPELDVIIASLHPFLGYDGLSKSEYTRALIRAINRPEVNILGHLANPMFEADLREVIEAAALNNVMVEINNSSLLPHTSRVGAYEIDLEIAVISKELGLPILVSSDAHFADDVGDFSAAMSLLDSISFKEEDILNCYPDRIEYYLNRKNKQ